MSEVTLYYAGFSKVKLSGASKGNRFGTVARPYTANFLQPDRSAQTELTVEPTGVSTEYLLSA
jgi:hypothetical protein